MSRGAILLAGGANTRMGQEKWLLPVGGETVLTRIIRSLSDKVDDLSVVLPYEAEDRIRSQAARAAAGVRVRWLQDEEPNAGPLAGIAVGLKASCCEWNLVAASDMPFLRWEAAEALFNACANAGVEAALAEKDGQTHPLFAVYRRSAAAELGVYRHEGGRKVMEWVGRLNTTVVAHKIWAAADPDGMTLFNMNTPVDYERANRMIVKWRGTADDI